MTLPSRLTSCAAGTSGRTTHGVGGEYGWCTSRSRGIQRQSLPLQPSGIKQQKKPKEMPNLPVILLRNRERSRRRAERLPAAIDLPVVSEPSDPLHRSQCEDFSSNLRQNLHRNLSVSLSEAELTWCCRLPSITLSQVG